MLAVCTQRSRAGSPRGRAPTNLYNVGMEQVAVVYEFPLHIFGDFAAALYQLDSDLLICGPVYRKLYLPIAPCSIDEASFTRCLDGDAVLAPCAVRDWCGSTYRCLGL